LDASISTNAATALVLALVLWPATAHVALLAQAKAM
jgi:hypothetical protein